MATLMPEVEWDDLNKLKAPDIKRLQCCEIYSDDEYLFSFIRPSTDYIRAKAENDGQLSNTVSGEIPEDVIRQATAVNPVLAPLKAETVAGDAPTKRKYKKHKHRVKK